MSRLSRLVPIVGGAVAGGAIALVVASGSGGTTHSVTTETVTQQAGSAAVPTALSTSNGLTINQIYRAASPGVVDITVSTNQGGSSGLLPGGGGSGGQQATGEGAGVVYDNKGDILTDEHVVANATSVKVHFQDGRTADAKVLGTDPSTDVARDPRRRARVGASPDRRSRTPRRRRSATRSSRSAARSACPRRRPRGSSARSAAASPRPTTTRSPARSRPTRRSTPVTRAVRCSTPTATCSGLNDQIQTNSGSSAGVGFATPANTDARIANAIIAGKPVKHAYVGVELNSTSTGGAQVTQVQPILAGFGRRACSPAT